MGLPTRRHRVGAAVGPDQQVSLGLAPPACVPRPVGGDPVRFGGRAGQHPVAGEQVVDLAGHLHAAAGDKDQVVGHPLELGEHVRGQHHRHTVVDHGRHHRGHEVVAGQRVEHRHRFVEHEQPGPPCQRQRQCQLRLLAAGQLAGFAF